MKEFLRRTIGDFSWQPPAWLRSLAATVRARRAAFTLLVLLALVAGSVGTYAYTHRKLSPKPAPPHPPRFVHATITAPGIPALSDKPVLPTLVVRFDGSAAALPLLDQKRFPPPSSGWNPRSPARGVGTATAPSCSTPPATGPPRRLSASPSTPPRSVPRSG